MSVASGPSRAPLTSSFRRRLSFSTTSRAPSQRLISSRTEESGVRLPKLATPATDDFLRRFSTGVRPSPPFRTTEARSLRTAEVCANEPERLARARDAQSSSMSGSDGSPATKGGLCCDKCDGPHETDRCPVYKKPREDHPDAWKNFGRKKPLQMGDDAGDFRLSRARVVPQPGDGSCLFHSMAFGLGGSNARLLRRQLADFVAKNPSLEIAGDPLSDWVKWDSRSTVQQYASRMRISGWGGGIEMAAMSRVHNVNVHVFERTGLGFKRISLFRAPDGGKKNICVLYRGGVHYDALVPNQGSL